MPISFGSRGGVDEEVLPAEAGVSLTAVRIEDPERGSSARWSEPVAGDERLGLLPDHVAPEADPSPAGQLESEAGRLGDRGREAVRVAAAGGLEQDQQDVRAPGKRRQAMQPVGHLRGAVGAREAGRQVDEEQIDRAARQQRPADRECLIERVRRDDDEPFETDAASDRFDRVERAREVDPGHDRAGGLGLGHGPQCERRAAAGAVAAQGHARVPWQAPRSEDRVELGEAGRDDAFERSEGRAGVLVRGCRGDQRKRAVGQPPRSCRSPAGLEARQGRRHIRGPFRHPSSIEQMFYFVNGKRTLEHPESPLTHSAHSHAQPTFEIDPRSPNGDPSPHGCHSVSHW
jgi:hypothetical protein